MYIIYDDMSVYCEELMKFIEPSYPPTYVLVPRGSDPDIITKMVEKTKELRLSDDLKGPPVVELGRITYKSSGASMYIPKRIAKILSLNKESDSSLVIFSIDDYGFFLIKDAVLAKALKNHILDMRKKIEIMRSLGHS